MPTSRSLWYSRVGYRLTKLRRMPRSLVGRHRREASAAPAFFEGCPSMADPPPSRWLSVGGTCAIRYTHAVVAFVAAAVSVRSVAPMVRAMLHMKPTSSRAIATTATCAGLH